jgi:TolB-like protein
MRCLAKRPEDRPHSAREILDALDEVDLVAERGRDRAAAMGSPGFITPASGPQGTVLTPSATGMRDDTRAGDTGPHAYPDGTVLIPTSDSSIAVRRRNRSRIAIGGGVAASVIALAVIFGTRFMKGRTSQPLDDSSLAVVPFRVASADQSLHYLREGMVDLIAAKLSGEEMRAVDPRVMLDAWQRAGGSASKDLSRDATLRLAKELGAARALLGDVVGTPNRLVLNLSLLDVRNGKQISRVSVDGPPDSLASLVDRIATRLLTETSTEGATRLPGLTGTSLPALRAYLDGQSRLRRGEAVAAAQDFNRALHEDSTFALAGLGAWLAAGWYGDPQLSDRGIRVAWQNRQKLSDRDKALLLALVGPHYPDPSTAPEVYRERERYVSIARDDAEAAYLLADEIFHFGSVLGITDWEERSLAGFRRAMELDSTYLPGYIHALPLAPSLGDSAFTRRSMRLLLAADTSAFRRFQADWYFAVRRGDTAAADALWNKIPPPAAEGILSNVVRTTIFDGTGASYAKRAVEQLMTLSRTEQERRARARYGHEVLMMLGRPIEALRYLDASRDSARDLNVPILKLRDASMGEVDRTVGDAAAREIRPYELGEPTDSLGRVTQRAAIRVMEPWRLLHGDTSQTRRSLARLRALATTVLPGEKVASQLEIGLIETMHADVTKSPALRQVLQRVDSTMMQLEFGATHPGRLAQTAVTLARIWEKLGDEKRALLMIMRHPQWSSESLPYLGVQMREEARIAMRAGERKRAQRSGDHFLRMRAIAEPSRRAQMDSVRREVGIR